MAAENNLQPTIVTVTATKRVKVTVQTAADREHHANGTFVVEPDSPGHFVVSKGQGFRVDEAPDQQAAGG